MASGSLLGKLALLVLDLQFQQFDLVLAGCADFCLNGLHLLGAQAVNHLLAVDDHGHFASAIAGVNAVVEDRDLIHEFHGELTTTLGLGARVVDRGNRPAIDIAIDGATGSQVISNARNPAKESRRAESLVGQAVAKSLSVGRCDGHKE